MRKGVATDAVHFLVDELLAALILGAILLMTLPLLGVVIPEDLRVLIHRQPRWLALAQGLLLAEVAGYWGHRTSHELPALWRFHKLHHTIELMDWLAPNRRHPVDMALARASVVLVIAPLGFAVPTIAAHFAIKRFQGLLVHANVRLNAGLLTWLVATPEFHHWHHADEPRAYNKNYAGQLPVVDLLFGTLYMPRPSWPTRYGCGEVAPEGHVAQLMWPFRRSALVAPISTRGHTAHYRHS